jgi:hypothetical protein
MTRNHPDPLSYLSRQPHKAKQMRLSTRSPYPPSYPHRRRQTLHAHHPFRRRKVRQKALLATLLAGRPWSILSHPPHPTYRLQEPRQR